MCQCRGVIAGGGGSPPQTFGQQHFLGFFSHTTDRSGVKLGQSYMIMSDKTAIFQLKSQ